MPLWGLSGWSDSVNKRMCRFLIHRYLGHLLKEKLSLEQLSVDLYNGTGTIQDVNVDVQYVNEILETLKVPIRLVDGYIGEITAAVPWAQLLNDSCLMEVKRLEVTIQPLKAVKLADLQSDLVSSMIESVMGSLASSMELAKSFLNESQGAEETEHEAEEGGVEAFAQIIDAVMSRMRLVFVDTVVRLENPPRSGDSGLSSAIELQIDRLCTMRFRITFWLLNFAIAHVYFVAVVCGHAVDSMVWSTLLTLLHSLLLFLSVWSLLVLYMTPTAAIPACYVLSPSEMLLLMGTNTVKSNTENTVSRCTENRTEDWRLCEVCAIRKPPRAHHCGRCERCHLRFDHHCFFLGVCIEWSNHKAFIVFVLYATLISLLQLVVLTVFKQRVWTDFSWLMRTVHLTALVLSVVYTQVGCATMLVQWFGLLNNLTVIELWMELKDHRRNLRQYNYDLRRNWVELFGTNPLLWFLPVFSSRGDGCHFVAQSSNMLRV